MKIQIRFDGSPAMVSGHIITVEDESGHIICANEWKKDGKDYLLVIDTDALHGFESQPPTPEQMAEKSRAEVQAERRRSGCCLECGATREMADEKRRLTGVGCYEVPISPDDGTTTWLSHNWPEETPTPAPVYRCTGCGSPTGSTGTDRCLACGRA